MNPDENAEYRIRKENQEFDPVLAGEEGIRPESGQDDVALEQEQMDDNAEQMSGHNGSWHTFITP
jgi:hypothetical protein